jgi:hypothetical protein
MKLKTRSIHKFINIFIFFLILNLSMNLYEINYQYYQNK